LNLSVYCMSTSCAPRINLEEKYLTAAAGKAPGGFPCGELVAQR